jgi:hypothetical protein
MKVKVKLRGERASKHMKRIGEGTGFITLASAYESGELVNYRGHDGFIYTGTLLTAPFKVIEGNSIEVQGLKYPLNDVIGYRN